MTSASVDPNLRPERSWTTELTAERDLANRTLNNADVNGFTYQGVSKYLSTDLRLHCRAAPALMTHRTPPTEAP